MRDVDEKSPPQGPGEGHSRRAVEMSCPDPALLAELPYRRDLDPDFAEALVRHLSKPCDTCWNVLEVLPTVVSGEMIRDGSRMRPFGLSAHNAVIRALWTVTGAPPTEWLPPGRHEALRSVREPHGFLRLVIEESLSFAELFGTSRHELEGWVEVADSLRQSGRFDFAAERIYTHGLLHVARFEAPFSADIAFELLDRASRAHERANERQGVSPALDALFHAREILVHATAAESRSPDFAHEQYHLAASRLAGARHAPYRVEIMLRHADFLLRSRRLDEMQSLLLDFYRTVDRFQRFRLLAEHHWLLLAELALARSKAAGPYSVLQFAHLAEASGIMARTTRVWRHHHCALSQRQLYLSSRIAEHGRNLPKKIPRCRSREELQMVAAAWTLYCDIREVRDLLRPILERHLPGITDAPSPTASEPQ